MTKDLKDKENDNEISQKDEKEILNDDSQDKDQLISSLKEEIKKLEDKSKEQNDKILRSLAEIENLRNRNIAEVEKANSYAISKFAGELVLVAENFYLAIDNMPKDEIEKNKDVKNFAVGVEMTKNELVKIFEKYGIKRINPIGEKFDHNFHEAIAKVEDDDESGTIKKVIQAGYQIKERLIRPALVEVVA